MESVVLFCIILYVFKSIYTAMSKRLSFQNIKPYNLRAQARAGNLLFRVLKEESFYVYGQL